jgi:hypothetical protein
MNPVFLLGRVDTVDAKHGAPLAISYANMRTEEAIRRALAWLTFVAQPTDLAPSC